MIRKEICFLSFCLFLTSCTFGRIQTHELETFTKMPDSVEITVPVQGGSSSDCLSPIENFGYQTGEVSLDFDWSEVSKKILPPKEWEKITNIPNASQLVLIQSHDKDTVFWIGTDNSGLVRYQVRGTQWGEGIFLPGPTDDLRGFPLFVDRENNVWGGRLNRLLDGDSDPLLVLYNEESNQWEPVIIDLDMQNKLSISHIEVDEQGIFWLLVFDGVEYQLFNLDTKTMTLQRHLTEYVLQSSAFAISHNTIFVAAVSNDPIPRFLLLQYQFEDDEVKVEYVGAPIYYDYQRTNTEYLPDTLFVDNKQRVWFGTRGWFDLSTNEWHFIIPDPVFITVLLGAGDWKWNEPEITSETPDGRLWYSALRGTGWVDPRLGKWCVFTSYRSNVLTDSYGNLWLIADDSLYRYPVDLK